MFFVWVDGIVKSEVNLLECVPNGTRPFRAIGQIKYLTLKSVWKPVIESFKRHSINYYDRGNYSNLDCT